MDGYYFMTEVTKLNDFDTSMAYFEPKFRYIQQRWDNPLYNLEKKI